MEKLIYKGFIVEKDNGDGDLLYIDSIEYPISEEFMYRIQGKNVSISYYISDVEKTKEELLENFIATMCGSVDADFCAHYSEFTGYLWTDQNINVGGHDLMSELESYIGKYIYMEIDIHN